MNAAFEDPHSLSTPYGRIDCGTIMNGKCLIRTERFSGCYQGLIPNKHFRPGSFEPGRFSIHGTLVNPTRCDTFLMGSNTSPSITANRNPLHKLLSYPPHFGKSRRVFLPFRNLSTGCAGAEHLQGRYFSQSAPKIRE